MAEVKTEGTKVYLDGVEPMCWSTGEMCEFASALTRTLACVGEDVPYRYTGLRAYEGLAATVEAAPVAGGCHLV